MTRLRMFTKGFLRNIVKWIRTVIEEPKQEDFLTDELPNKFSNLEYWSKHNVTLHADFTSREESLNFLHWRNSQYLFLENLMPSTGFDGKVILDYGCGPGNDLVGFVEFSKPKKVVGVDISPTSLEEAKKRLLNHNSAMVELKNIEDGAKELPFDDCTFDYIHSSGVLHHLANIDNALQEFKRILKPNGIIRIMIYNYDSVYLHLNVAYKLCIAEEKFMGIPLTEAFRKSTDGVNCPISKCYDKDSFIEICVNNGYNAKFLNSAVCVTEMLELPLRYEAILCPELDKEHRDFLRELTFDDHGLPIYRGYVAGIDAVYELTPKLEFVKGK